MFDPSVHGGMGPRAAASLRIWAGAAGTAVGAAVFVVSAAMRVCSWASVRVVISGFGQVLEVEVITKTQYALVERL